MIASLADPPDPSKRNGNKPLTFDVLVVLAQSPAHCTLYLRKNSSCLNYNDLRSLPTIPFSHTSYDLPFQHSAEATECPRAPDCSAASADGIFGRHNVRQHAQDFTAPAAGYNFRYGQGGSIIIDELPGGGVGQDYLGIPYHSTAATNRAWNGKVPANGLLSSGVGLEREGR